MADVDVAQQQPAPESQQLVERLVTEVTAFPPKVSPEDVATQASIQPPEVVSSLIVALCQMLQTLAREVEVEREQLLDAQSALTEVLQRVVTQARPRPQAHRTAPHRTAPHRA